MLNPQPPADLMSATTTSPLQFVMADWPLESSYPSSSSSASAPSSLPSGQQRCGRCSFTAPITAFPMRRTGVGHLKSCTSCISKQVVKKARKDNKEPPPASLPTISFDAYLAQVESHKDRTFDFDAFVELPEGMFGEQEHLYSRTNKMRDRIAEVSEFHWNQKKSTRGGKSTVVTYHCAQLEGEQTRRTPKEDDGNRRNRREKLKRYHCGGWLKITVVDENDLLVRIRISHAEAHPPFPGKAEKRAISEPLDEVRPADAVAVGQSASPIYEPAAAASASASVSGDDDGGDYWMPDEHNMNMPPQSNVYEEEEPRVYFSPQRLTALRAHLDMMIDIANDGVPSELARTFEYIFSGLERVSEDTLNVTEERRSKKRRTS